MGLIARMFVRTAAEPSAVAAAVLGDEQIVSAGDTVASDLVVRPVMVWRCADWVVVEDLVASTMAASASTLGEVVTVECFEDAGSSDASSTETTWQPCSSVTVGRRESGGSTVQRCRPSSTD
jgi:hypothetical protein